MDQVKVSVIIPVYNGETYLRQCLDSVCAQTLKDIEIICVDDGSVDASWTILEEYREADNRFQLIRHSENLGLPAGRNSGQAVARGEYLIFWDCDDFFEPKALELLYQRAVKTNADICVCNADRYFEDQGKRFPFPYLHADLVPKDAETFNRLTNPKYILNFTTVCVWNKLLRRGFMEEHHLTTPPFRFGEDIYFSINALCLAERIAVVKNVLVHYRFNNSASMVGQSGMNTKSYLPPYLAVADHLRDLGILPEESFGWATIDGAIFILRLSETKEVFMETAALLHEEGVLEKLCIVERESGYYRNPRQERYAKHLIHDDPEDLLAFFMHETYLEMREVVANRNAVRAERDKVKKQLAKEKETNEATLSQLAEETNLLETERQRNRQLEQEQKTLTVESCQQAAALDMLKDEKQRLQQENKALTEEGCRQAAALDMLKDEKQRLQQENKALTEESCRQAAALQIMTEERQRQQTELEATIRRNLQLTVETETLSAQLTKTKKKLKSVEKQREDILNSETYRLGKALLYIPHKIRQLFRKK